MARFDDGIALTLVTLTVTLIILGVTETGARYYQGRHVCQQKKNVTRNIPFTQTYKRPVYRKDLRKLTYVTAYKTVFRVKLTTMMVKSCCHGWAKEKYRDKNCMKPICQDECQNGGTCIAPDLCMCPKGYAGFMCQIEIDECKGRHSCQQTCANTPGSYKCGCRKGFILTEDETTCDLCLSCTEEFQGLQKQMDEMRNKVIELQEDREILRKNLTTALSDYESAVSALSGRGAEGTQYLPTSPAYVDESSDYQADYKDQKIDMSNPWPRLASMSEQISMLEEKMAQCSCDDFDDY